MSYSTRTNAPWRGDIVGSFLRPEALKSARAEHEAGKISAEELKAIEDEHIKALIEKQKAAGLKVITDGEFRRAYWHLDFMWGLNGIERIEKEHGYFFKHVETTKGGIKVTGKISGENHPFVEHFKFVKQFETEGIVARQTIPAPAQMYAELFLPENTMNTLKLYPNQEDLIQDMAAAYRQVIKDLAAAGCRNIQFDDCTWGLIVDKNFFVDPKTGKRADLTHMKETYLRLNNLALQDRPEGVTITTHICRGNYFSSWACEGAYDDIAKYPFAQENVDAFYLEYDDDRSGGFEPLSFIPKGKRVVLGLVTSKRPELENVDSVVARINEAAQFVDLDHLCVSTQCGFASCEIGNKLSDEQQWAKVALVQQIAKQVWG